MPSIRLSAARQVIEKVSTGEIEGAEGERLVGFILLPTPGGSRATWFRRMKRLRELGVELPPELRE
jgi:hypothetical protein